MSMSLSTTMVCFTTLKVTHTTSNNHAQFVACRISAGYKSARKVDSKYQEYNSGYKSDKKVASKYEEYDSKHEEVYGGESAHLGEVYGGEPEHLGEEYGETEHLGEAYAESEHGKVESKVEYGPVDDLYWEGFGSFDEHYVYDYDY